MKKIQNPGTRPSAWPSGTTARTAHAMVRAHGAVTMPTAASVVATDLETKCGEGGGSSAGEARATRRTRGGKQGGSTAGRGETC
jgi:hypothetical protein